MRSVSIVFSFLLCVCLVGCGGGGVRSGIAGHVGYWEGTFRTMDTDPRVHDGPLKVTVNGQGRISFRGVNSLKQTMFTGYAERAGKQGQVAGQIILGKGGFVKHTGYIAFDGPGGNYMHGTLNTEDGKAVAFHCQPVEK